MNINIFRLKPVTNSLQGINNTNGVISGNFLKAGNSLIIARGKRTSGLNGAAASKAVTLLSVISAHKMIPRRIKLSFEDQIRYQSIHKAWCLYQEKKRNLRNFNLKKQYVSAQEACDDLESLSLNEGIDEKGGFAFLYHSATVTERGKRFPLDMKIPTETPPTRIWNDSWKPQTEEGQDPKSGVREIETNKETVKETATD